MGKLYGVELKSAWVLWPRCGYKEQVAYETCDIFLVHGEANNSRIVLDVEQDKLQVDTSPLENYFAARHPIQRWVAKALPI